MVAQLQSQYPLSELLAAVGLARSTYYYHLARLDRSDKYAQLRQMIRTVFARAHGRYGHRRIRLVLHNQGIRISRKLTMKLMKEEGLVCRVRARKRYNSYRGTVSRTAPNILNRKFNPPHANHSWVSDVSEFRIGKHKLYLSPVIDLYDHSVLGFALGTSANCDLTNESLRHAFKRAQLAPRLLVHTDQGVQYQSAAWKKILIKHQAIPSMSRKGNCHDNALAENFFSHIKTELFYQHTFTTLHELKQAIRAYIHWYNTKRIQEGLNSMTPSQYRKTHPNPTTPLQ